MAKKANSKPCKTSEVELFPQVFTGFRGELAKHVIWSFLEN